jgi:hypothetical protein
MKNLFDFLLHYALLRDIITVMVWRFEMEYMTTKQAAEEWGVKVRQVQVLCENGKITTASRLGNMWVIPKGTSKPIDGRTKQAKHLKAEVQNV